jgi:hypothetical protein
MAAEVHPPPPMLRMGQSQSLSSSAAVGDTEDFDENDDASKWDVDLVAKWLADNDLKDAIGE